MTAQSTNIHDPNPRMDLFAGPSMPVKRRHWPRSRHSAAVRLWVQVSLAEKATSTASKAGVYTGKFTPYFVLSVRRLGMVEVVRATAA
jgi:hypothetical protein